MKLQIADYFNVSLDYLFGRTNIKDTAENILNNSSTSTQLRAGYEDENISSQIAEEIKKFKEYLMHKYRKDTSK